MENKIKILIVEDKTIVALDLKKTILKLGYDVTETVTNYDDALESVNNNQPDFIFMDIHLDNSKDGIETAKEINKDRKIPIIYLTAYSDDETIGRAVVTNPIAYLLKPFNREELKSTLLLGIHKIKEEKKREINKDHISLGANYYYDIKSENLFYQDKSIKLSAREKKLLTLLVRSHGTLVDLKTLEYNIWPDEPVSESALRTLVYRLRTKVEYKLIETISGVGVKLVRQP
ncbi:MAG: response regulator [Campylobacterales bacterium]|nr:response regulator [Campylobacterales bacterium]